MITVWGRRSSSNVQAVMWCIAELGLPYERIDAGFKYGLTGTDDYLAMNPNGRIPTIKDGEMPALWESSAILRYLAAQYGAAQYGDDTFWPTDAAARSKVDQWAEWSKVNVALNFTSPIFWQVVRTPVEKQNPQKIQQAIDEFESYLSIANRQLENNPYIAGESFTLADIQFAHVLFRYYDIPITRQPFDALAEYYARISQRPDYRSHVAVNYEELRNSK